MIPLVLDASVAAKWLLPASGEPLAEEAATLLARYRRSEIGILVPDIFWAELGSVLWKSVRLGRCSDSMARLAVASLADLPFPTISSLNLLESAFGIAITFGRSIYDCMYVALAVKSNAPLITADEKLANALAARFPVKWLGASHM